MLERYTPGYSRNSVELMAARSAQTHAAYLLPYLKPGLSLLDCGCGPGSITSGLATAVKPGVVIGVDVEDSQVSTVREAMRAHPMTNLTFQTADVYRLPFADETFDVVFSNALLEHLDNPLAALAEFRRVLVPGGLAAVSSPDWGGFILAPSIPGLYSALDAYTGLMRSNGAEPTRGRELGDLLAQANFDVARISARFECYRSIELIAGYLANQLDTAAMSSNNSRGNAFSMAAKLLRTWSKSDRGLFAQAWVEAVASKPG